MIETRMILDGVELPYPPSVNNYWVSGRNRHTGQHMKYLTARARTFKQVVGLLCGRRQPFTGRVGVRVLVWPPDRRTRDLDNLLKGLLDSITGAGVILDDCQIDEIHMVRESVRKGGAVQVWLWARSQTDERRK